MADTPEPPLTLAEDLRTAIHHSPLPFALLDIDSMRVLDANEPACALLARDPAEIRGLPLREVLLPEDEPAVTEALRLVRSGAIDAYEARRQLRRADGSLLDARLWVRSVRDLLPSGALAIFSPEHDDDDRSLGVHDAAVAAAVMARPDVIGACDVELRITSVSSDVKVLLGRRPDGLIGMPFVDWVHPDDVATFLLAVGRCLADGVSVGAALRVQDADGEYVPMRLVVSPLHGRTGARFGFVLTSDRPEATNGGRARELEQRLWRIALEVHAAGMLDEMHSLPDPARLSQAYELSSRQWEVLARLSRGERVPSIAKAMYVNQSTVRNHLSAIFRKLGVHSQAELLDHIRSQN